MSVQAIVVIKTKHGRAQNVIDELQQLENQLEVLEITRLTSGPYQVLIRVSLADEAETVAVDRMIRIIDGVKNFDIWFCEEVVAAPRQS